MQTNNHSEIPQLPAPILEEKLVVLSSNDSLYSVSDTVNTARYHTLYEGLPLPKPVREALYKMAGTIMQKTNGTRFEHLVALDARTGIRIVDNLSRAPGIESTGFTHDEMRAVRAHSGRIITIHNHPASRPPSYRDIMTLASDSQIKASLVIGHDGSVWYLSVDDPRIAQVLEMYYDLFAMQYGEYAEQKAVSLLRSKYGTKQGFDWRELR